MHEQSRLDTDLQREVAVCSGASDPATARANVHGPDLTTFDFHLNSNDSASSTVVVAASRAAYKSDLAAFRGGDYEPCVKRVYSDQYRRLTELESPGDTVSTFSVHRFETPVYGDVTVALHLIATIYGADNINLTLYLDTIVYARNRSEVTLTFSSYGQLFLPSLELSLLAKAAAKLKAAV